MAARIRANSAAQFLPRMMSCPISEEIAIGTFVSASKSLQLRLTTGRRVVSPCTPVRAIEVDGWGTGAPSVSSCLSRPELTIEWSAPLSSRRRTGELNTSPMD